MGAQGRYAQGLRFQDPLEPSRLRGPAAHITTITAENSRIVRFPSLQFRVLDRWRSDDPCDYRLYAKARDGLTKNDHFRAMLAAAADRGLDPRCVLFDHWYTSLENLKAIRAPGWSWLTQLKPNRTVNSDGTGSVPVSLAGATAAGRVVHLQGYGRIKVFAIAAKDGGIEYWATNDLEMSELTRLELAERVWAVEEYHRGLKQYCGAERCQARGHTARRNHVGLAIRALLRLE
jgi:hypothetical protein